MPIYAAGAWLPGAFPPKEDAMNRTALIAGAALIVLGAGGYWQFVEVPARQAAAEQAAAEEAAAAARAAHGAPCQRRPHRHYPAAR